MGQNRPHSTQHKPSHKVTNTNPCLVVTTCATWQTTFKAYEVFIHSFYLLSFWSGCVVYFCLKLSRLNSRQVYVLERCPLHRKFREADKSNHNIIEHLRDKMSADVCRVFLKITAIWHQISLGHLLAIASSRNFTPDIRPLRGKWFKRNLKIVWKVTAFEKKVFLFWRICGSHLGGAILIMTDCYLAWLKR